MTCLHLRKSYIALLASKYYKEYIKTLRVIEHTGKRLNLLSPEADLPIGALGARLGPRA